MYVCESIIYVFFILNSFNFHFSGDPFKCFAPGHPKNDHTKRINNKVFWVWARILGCYLHHQHCIIVFHDPHEEIKQQWANRAVKQSTLFCFDVFFFFNVFCVKMAPALILGHIKNQKHSRCLPIVTSLLLDVIRDVLRLGHVFACTTLVPPSIPQYSPPLRPHLGAVLSSHSVISLLIWLIVNILAMRPPESSSLIS